MSTPSFNDRAWTEYTITYNVITQTFSILDNATGDLDQVSTVERFTFGGVTVDVRSTQGGLTPDVIITSNGPSITSSAATNSVSEAAIVGTVVTTVSATDVNLPAGDYLTYSLGAVGGGAYTGPFSINSTGVITVSAPLDRETAATHSFVVRVVDEQGQAATQTLTVNLTDVNDTAPTITSAASVSVQENVAAVLTLASTDPDLVGGPTTYSIVGGADAALFQIVGGVLRFSSPPNFEAPLDAGANNVYDVIVQASDG